MQMASVGVVPEPALSLGASGSNTGTSRLTIVVTTCPLVEATSCLFWATAVRPDPGFTLQRCPHACSAGDSFSSSTGTGRLASRTSADYSNMGLAESVAQQQEEVSELHQQRGTEEPPEANGSHMGPMERGMASWHSSADGVSVMPAAENGSPGQAVQLASMCACSLPAPLPALASAVG